MTQIANNLPKRSYESAETEGTELYLSESNTKISKKTLDEYIAKVFALRPNLKEIYDETKKVDLLSYDKRHIRENRNPIIKTRKAELIEVIEKRVRKVLGSKIAESVTRQLKGNSSVSTTQHTAPLGHYVLKLALQNALPYFDNDNPNLQNVIILACAGVSFNNSSTPRSLLLHTDKDLDYLPFFGRSADATPVIYHPAYGPDSVENMQKELSKIRQSKGLGKLQFDTLREIIDDVYASPHVLSQEYFTDQITIINNMVFQKVFENYKGKVPNLVFISQEEIVTDLILNNHLESKTTIHNVLFSSKMHELLEKHFDAVDGTFNLKNKKAPFFFGAMIKKKKAGYNFFVKANI